MEPKEEKLSESNDNLDGTDDLDQLEREAQEEIELIKNRLGKRHAELTGSERKLKPYRQSDELITSVSERSKKAIPEIKLTYNREKEHSPVDVSDSATAAAFIKNLYEEKTIDLQEQFAILYLNRRNRIIGYNTLFKGGLTGTVVDHRLIFATALKSLATGIIMAHNHPSGQLKPSEADLRLTRRIKEAATLMDIQLLDHIIVSSEGYYSFADEGVL